MSRVLRQIDYQPAEGLSRAGPRARRRGVKRGRARWVAPIFALAVVVGAVLPLTAAASHPTPALPLTADNVAALRASLNCNSGQIISENLAIPPDRKVSGGVPSGNNNRYFGAARDNANNTTASNIAVWANADNDPELLTLDISGSDLVINGDVVSRSHLKISDNRGVYLHATEYGTRGQKSEPAFDMGGSDNCFNLEPDQVPRNPAPPPANNLNTPAAPAGFPLNGNFDPDSNGLVLEHLAPSNAGTVGHPVNVANLAGEYFTCPNVAGTGVVPFPLECSGNEIVTKAAGQPLKNGIYYVPNGKVDLSASNIGEAKVTFVSGKQIAVKGSVEGQSGAAAEGGCFLGDVPKTVFKPYHLDLLFASEYFPGAANTKDAEDAIKVEGSKSCFQGIIVATNGRVQLSGEQNSFTCPVMGDRVRLNGSKLYISNECLDEPDIEINKTPDGEVTVNAGADATFTITVTNGGGPANNVDVEDVLPGTGWTIVTKTFSGTPLPQGLGPDDCAITGGNTLHCDIATFGTGQQLVIVVKRATTTADCASSSGPVRLDNGSITGGPAEVEVNDVDVDTDPGHLFIQCPDAKVEKTPDNGTVNAGQTATFTITVTALGPGTSFNVKLDDPPLPNNPPHLPDSGFTWSLGAANDEASCTLTGPSGSQILHCDFGNIPFPGSKTIKLSTPTDAADCDKGLITNPVKISGDGDTNAGNNEDTGSLTVICGAIRILKNSTKGGAVNNAGAVFSVDGPDANNTPDFSVTDDLTAAVPDEDADVGEVCVDGLEIGATYTVNETSPPTGYGGASQLNVPVVAVAGSCPDGAFNAATFTNPPLGEFIINWNDLGSGETKARIDCTGLTPTPPDSSNPPTLHDDDTETYTNLPAGNPPIVYSCTISADP